MSDIDPNVQYLCDASQRNFYDAKNFCAQRKGLIVKTESLKIQNYIQSLAGCPAAFWLNALQTAQNSKVFKWPDDNSIVTNIIWGTPNGP